MHRSEVVVKTGLITAGTEGVSSVQEWINMFDQRSATNCCSCGTGLVRSYRFVHNPFLLAFDVSTNIDIINSSLSLPVNGSNFDYKLRGIIYYGSNHFTARVMTVTGQVWFHNGITTGASMEYDGMMSNLSPGNLVHCRSKAAVVAIYCRTRSESE